MSSNSRKQSHRGGSRNRHMQQGGDATAGVPQISEATLKQAGEIAQKLLGQSMQQGNNAPQTGGSAGGNEPSSIKQAMVGGALAGAVAGASMAEAAESKSGLNMSPLVGGKRRKGKGQGKGRSVRQRRQSQSQSQSENQNQNQNQTGGMVPGLMAAVETALVPLGLYLGQKALQSRRSGKSFGRSFNFRRFSRRGRSRSSRRR